MISVFFPGNAIRDVGIGSMQGPDTQLQRKGCDNIVGVLLPGEMDGGDAAARDGASVWSGDLDSLLSDGNISLDPDLLPFPRGRFSFGVGVNLKMAVSRWTNWAADVGIREENMGAEEG